VLAVSVLWVWRREERGKNLFLVHAGQGSISRVCLYH